MVDPRYSARILALQDLYAKIISETEALGTNDLLAENELSSYDRDLRDKLVKNIPINIDLIDETIKKFAPSWPLEKIARVDLMILRLAIWEGFIGKTAPIKVIMDQYIEMGKEFSGVTSSKFINGVLANTEEIDKYINKND